jgi:putative SOS response-associated peptidase YedK
MCGRFTLRTNPQQLSLVFDCAIPADLPPRYNIAPTQMVAAVRHDSAGDRGFSLLRWGLIPHWAKDLSIGARMINARAETVAEKPSFRTAFRQRRCLILSDGYFEWQKQGKAKQPFLIRMADEHPFAMAGLWEVWNKASDGQPVMSCTVITTQANSLTQPIHDRMPVILDHKDYDQWLDCDVAGPAKVSDLLRPFGSSQMAVEAVDPWVNNARHDDPRCVRPLDSDNDRPQGG